MTIDTDVESPLTIAMIVLHRSRFSTFDKQMLIARMHDFNSVNGNTDPFLTTYINSYSCDPSFFTPAGCN